MFVSLDFSMFPLESYGTPSPFDPGFGFFKCLRHTNFFPRAFVHENSHTAMFLVSDGQDGFAEAFCTPLVVFGFSFPPQASMFFVFDVIFFPTASLEF